MRRTERTLGRTVGAAHLPDGWRRDVRSLPSSRPTPRLVALGGGSGLPIVLRGLQAAIFPRGWMGVGRNGGGGLQWGGKSPVSILLAGDDQGVRAAVKRLLEAARGAQVVGEAADGEEAVRLARELRPDVTLMDLSIPRLASSKAIRRIKADRPETKVMILTDHREDASQQTAGEFGADALLPKRALIALLLSMKPQAEARRRARWRPAMTQGGRPS